eukprot:5210361-Ditylum_brightwellii.AAC.1
MGAMPVLRHAWEQTQQHHQQQQKDEKIKKDPAEENGIDERETLSTTTNTTGKKMNVPCYVNLAGRCYQSPNGHYIDSLSQSKRDELLQHKKFELQSQGQRRRVVTEQDIKERDQYDSSF